jgi:uncharacterized protein YjiS (DUF1127 family)
MLMNQSTIAVPARPATPLIHRRSGLRWIAGILQEWAERRRSRRHLAELDVRLLRDIGLSPAEAMREALLPFWKP